METTADLEKEIKELEIKDIISVYSGKDGFCCCGCSGNHYYNSNLVKEASKNRGYQVGNDEINDKMVKRVLNIFKKTSVKDIDFEEAFYATVVGNRLYIIYLNK